MYLGTQICFAQASQSSEFTFTGNGDWYAEDLITRSDGTIVQLLRQQEGLYDKILILSSSNESIELSIDFTMNCELPIKYRQNFLIIRSINIFM